MVLAPEHELVEKITTPEQRQAIDEYLNLCKKQERQGTNGGSKTGYGLLYRSLCHQSI